MSVSAHVIPSSTAVRIIRDPKSNDGWIARNGTGKICFIDNLSQYLTKLEPGQQWQANIIKEEPSYLLIHLEIMLRN